MVKKSHYVIWKDKKGEYRWKLTAPNGEAVATSEGYGTRKAATESAKKMKVWAATEEIVFEKPKRPAPKKVV